jgi:hypothetical protein
MHWNFFNTTNADLNVFKLFWNSSFLIYFILKFSNFSLWILNSCMWYLEGGFIIRLIKIIKNDYNIYSWIITISTKISTNTKCDLFKMLKVSHLIMLLSI